MLHVRPNNQNRTLFVRCLHAVHKSDQLRRDLLIHFKTAWCTMWCTAGLVVFQMDGNQEIDDKWWLCAHLQKMRTPRTDSWSGLVGLSGTAAR